MSPIERSKEKSGASSLPQNEDLIENEDFYFDENGLFVLTKKFLEKRGSCCQMGCRHCPYEAPL